MSMYFPDLKSVQKLADDMGRHEGNKKYVGIYPKSESELPEARKQLANYLRVVWNDEVFAMEVELGITEGNYHTKMGSEIYKRIFIKGKVKK